MDTLETEARLFAHYLIGKPANQQAIELYTAAMHSSKPASSDKKLLQYMVAHPRTIGFIDAGLVFHNASSEARRRLYVMLAILEAIPEYSDSFLARQRSPLYILAIGYSGVRAVFKAAVGLVLVKVIA